MAIGLGMYLGWNDLNGKCNKSTLFKKVRELLSRCPKEAFIKELVAIGVSIDGKRGETDPDLRNKYLDQKLAQKVTEGIARERRDCDIPVLIFHKRALLLLHAFADSYCACGATTSLNLNFLGKAFLYANSLCQNLDYGIKDHEAASDFFIRNGLFHNTPCVAHSLPRAYVVYSALEKFKLDNVFSRKGFELFDFFTTIFAIKALRQRHYFFKGCVFDSLKDEIVDKAKSAFQTLVNMSSGSDFTSETLDSAEIYRFFDLRKRPVLAFSADDYAFLCQEFLDDLYWHGTYYAIIDSCSESEKKLFFKEVGESFEKYVYALTQYSLGKNRVSKRKTPNGNPLNDAVIEIEPGWLLVLEFKNTRNDSNTISGENPSRTVFERIIYREGSSKKSKGLAQLFSRINEFRKTDPSTRITPILITGDTVPVFKETWGVWNEFLKDDPDFKEFFENPNNDFPLISGVEAWERLLSFEVRNVLKVQEVLNHRTDESKKYSDLYQIVREFAQERRVSEDPHPLLFAIIRDLVERYPLKKKDPLSGKEKHKLPKKIDWHQVFDWVPAL